MFASTRRDFIRTVLGGAAGLTLSTLTHPAFGQGRGPAPITATKLTDRLVVFGGVGGNVGLVIGDGGVLMVDGGTANRAADLAKAIADVSPSMVQVLFNTHYHFDHTGSNVFLGKNRIRLIAHENVKTRLSTRFENAAMGRTDEPMASEGLPTETFSSGGTMTFGREALAYTHFPEAHTDGDAWVFFRNANVLHTGDLFWVGRYPVVDYSVRGSLARMAASLDAMDKIVDDSTRIIPGHGPASVTRVELRQTREMWLAINGRLEQLAAQGLSVEDVIKAAPTKDFDEKLNVRMPEGFVRQAYGGVLARKG